MESAKIEVNPDLFNKAVHGGLDDLPVLKEGGDLAVYFKDGATENGRACGVITFTVQLPDGTLARAQVVTTANIFEMIGGAVKGWRESGLIR